MSAEEHLEYAVLADGEPRMDGSSAQVVLGSGFASLAHARQAMAGVSQQRLGLRIAVRRVTDWSVVERAADVGSRYNPYANCGPKCAEPVPCPDCGTDLPPLGRSVPQEMYLSDCCDERRFDSTINTRHLWSVTELEA